MAGFLKAAVAGTLGFMLLDGLWLGLVMKNFYRDRLAPIARMSNGALAPHWAGALVVYLLLGLGIALFAVPRDGDTASAAVSGGLLGLVVYGVYDFTNYATLRSWPLALALVDTAWGAVAAGVCAVLARAVTR